MSDIDFAIRTLQNGYLVTIKRGLYNYVNLQQAFFPDSASLIDYLRDEIDLLEEIT